MQGGVLAAGAVIGLLVAAVVAGSFVLVIVLAVGAAAGAVAAGLAALLTQRLRGHRPARSGEAPMPTLTPQGSPEARRAEAGAASPSPSS